MFCRTPDVPLTKEGRSQVRAAAEWIAERYTPVRIVTSPFARARQTADILAAILGVAVVVEPGLRERSYGELAGQPYGALRARLDYDPDAYWQWCPPGGESLIEVATRAGEVLDRVARSSPGDDVVIVSHAAVMAALRCHVTGAWERGRVTPNAGITLVEHRDGTYLGLQLVSG
jgi:probable phosphoglycerate mutase